MARPFRVIALTLLALGGLASLAPAYSAASGPSRPTITSVAPKNPAVGDTLTVLGTGFSTRRLRNTVIFQSPKGKLTFVKPSRARRTKLVLKLPPTLLRLMSTKRSARVATRFRIRVLSSSFGPWTSAKRSPVVSPTGKKPGGIDAKADCDNDRVPNLTDPDDDNDLLSDVLEAKYALDPCKADTDLDGLSDGWEYYAARDLNLKAVPYPGKRPFPNPLDSSDAKTDFDGDSLESGEEYKLWRYTGSQFDEGRAGGGIDSPLGYSDGTQASRPNETPTVPAFQSPSYPIPFLPPAYPLRFEHRADGVWTDDERDGDRDGLNNFVETHGPGSPAWWKAKLAEESVEAWPKVYYGDFSSRPFLAVDPTDPDVDGDTLLDGEDDQDNDDVPNYWEMYDRVITFNAQPRQVNAFNPCAPDWVSRTCALYVPIGG